MNNKDLKTSNQIISPITNLAFSNKYKGFESRLSLLNKKISEPLQLLNKKISEPLQLLNKKISEPLQLLNKTMFRFSQLNKTMFGFSQLNKKISEPLQLLNKTMFRISDFNKNAKNRYGDDYLKRIRNFKIPASDPITLALEKLEFYEKLEIYEKKEKRIYEKAQKILIDYQSDIEMLLENEIDSSNKINLIPNKDICALPTELEEKLGLACFRIRRMADIDKKKNKKKSAIQCFCHKESFPSYEIKYEKKDKSPIFILDTFRHSQESGLELDEKGRVSAIYFYSDKNREYLYELKKDQILKMISSYSDQTKE